MRVRDLKPATEYSTCEGQLVVPVEPIHGNWYYVYDSKKNEWDLINGGGSPKVKQDPWGGCHPKKRNQPQQRRTSPGVLVDVYAVDRDGKLIESKKERRVVKPSDIAGTWKEYLVLYADVVRRRWDAQVEEVSRKVANDAIREHFADLYGVSFDDVSIYNHFRDTDDVDVRVAFKVKLPRTRAKNPPPSSVRACEALGIDIKEKVDDQLPG